MSITITISNDFDAAFDAGEITWHELDLPGYQPTVTEADLDTLVAEITTPAPTQEIPRDVFQASGAQLRSWGFTPTGRERKGGQAARAEIARRAARKAARRDAR